MSSQEAEHCPNCGAVGGIHTSAIANATGMDEWDCHNDNCRVSLYFVEAFDE